MSAASRGAKIFDTEWDWPWQWGLAALLALVLRLGLLDWFGVLQTEDSSGYVEYAEILVAKGGLWHAIAERALPTGFRALGYPAFLSITQEFAGPHWLALTVALQICLALLALWVLYRLGLALGMQRGYAAFSAGLFSCSHAAIYDISVLTDSVASHTLILGLCWTLIPLLERRTVSGWRLLGSGLGITASIMIRDATLYLVPVIMLGMAIVMHGRMNWKRLAYLQICLLLPVVVFWQGYVFWMVGKPGRQQSTSVGQSVYLLHPLDIEARGRKVLVNPLLREAYTATSGSYTYEHAIRINDYLQSKHALNEWQRLALAKNAYRLAWIEAPDQMLREVFKELRLKYATQLVDPSMPIREYPILAGLKDRTPRDAKSIFLIGMETGLRIFSALVFICAVVGVPVLLSRRSWRETSGYQVEGLAFSWLIFAGMIGMYAMIHMEWRYTLPAQGFIVMAGMAMLAETIRRLRQRFWPH